MSSHYTLSNLQDVEKGVSHIFLFIAPDRDVPDNFLTDGIVRIEPSIIRNLLLAGSIILAPPYR